MAVSKSLRYEILRRDNYACRYCGAAAPDVELEVDHVVPVALGGTDQPANLAAACPDCNSGKAASAPDAEMVADVAEDALRWRRAMEVANEMATKEAAARDAFRAVFVDQWESWVFTSSKWVEGKRVEFEEPEDLPAGWQATLDNLLAAGLTVPDMTAAVDVALTTRRIKDRFSYFCGVARNKLAARQAVARELIDRGLV